MCAAAMATVAPPLAFLLLLLQLADGSFPEEPSPLSYVPVEGMCPSCLVCMCCIDEWLVVNVEIKDQGSKRRCGAAFKLTNKLR